MASVKGLKTIAENLASAGRVARRADDLPPPRGTSTLDAFTNLDEYDEVAGDLEKLNDVPASPAEVRQEIEIRQAQEAENARRNGVTSPMADLRLDHQTANAEEFTERLNGQLRSSEFSSNSVLVGRSERFEKTVKESQDAHKATVETVLSGLRRNPRWVARSDEWIGDSPYKGDVMFHTDRVTDPTRPDSFIQFEDPRELGIHAGTNRAAESVIKPGPDETLMLQQQMQSELDQAASGLNMSTDELNRSVVRALENKLVAKFRKGEGLFDASLWDETMDTLTEFFTDINSRSPERAAEGMLERLRGIPTPNTTPLLFRGRNGLLLEDTGGFAVGRVSRQLEQIFPDNVQAIDAALGVGDRAAQTKAMTEFIESKGYDHIVYHNSVEDKGSLSIINWNPDLQRTPWHPDFTRDNPIEAAKQASAYVLGVLGVGSATVREE